MDFDYYAELDKFITACPFIYTGNNDFSDSDYMDFFLVKKKCNHTHRLPFMLSPIPLVTDFRKNIVQTYSKANNQGGIANLTLIQLSPLEHLSIVYSELENKFVASVAMYVNDAQRIPVLQGELSKYRIADKPKVAGFGAMFNTNN